MLRSQFSTPLAPAEDKSELQVVSITRKVNVNEDLLPYPNEAVLFKHLPVHPNEVLTCSVFGNGTKVVTTSIDGKVRIFDIGKVGHAIHVLDWNCRVVTAIGQNVLAAFCNDSELKTFSVRDMVITQLSSIVVDTFGTALVRLGDAELALGNSFGDLLFYTHRKGRNLQYGAYIRAHTDAIHCMDARGQNLITASMDMKVTLWDWKTKERLETFEKEAKITTVAINERFIFVATMANDVHIWYNEPDYQYRAHLRNLHIEQPVLALLPIGTDLLASADKVGDLIYTRLSSHKPVALDEVLASSKINALGLTSEGNIVTVGCAVQKDLGFAAIINPPKLVNTTVRAQAYRLYPKSGADDFFVFSPEPEDLESETPSEQRKRLMMTSSFSASPTIRKPNTQQSRRAHRQRRSILSDSMRTVSTSKAPMTHDPSAVSEQSRVFTEYVPPYHVQKELRNMPKLPRRSTRNNPVITTTTATATTVETQKNNDKMNDADVQLIEDMFDDVPIQEDQPQVLQENTQLPQFVNPQESPTANQNPSPQSANRPTNNEQVSPLNKKHRFVPPENGAKPPQLYANQDDVPYPRPEMNKVGGGIDLEEQQEEPAAVELPPQPPLLDREEFQNREPRPLRRNSPARRDDDRNHRRRSVQSRYEHHRHRERYSSRDRYPSPQREHRRRRERSRSPRRDRRRSRSPRRGRSSSPRDTRERRCRDHSPSSNRRFFDSRRRSTSRERHSPYRSRSRQNRRPSPYRNDYRSSHTPVRRHSFRVRHEPRRWQTPRSAMEAEVLSRVVEPLRFELRCVLPPHLANLGRGERRNQGDSRDLRDPRDRRNHGQYQR